MLSDDVVLRNCYHQAKKFYDSGVSFNELVSIGYIVGKHLSDERLLAQHLYYTMLHYIQDDVKHRNTKRFGENANTSIENGYEKKIEATQFSEEMEKVIEDAELSPIETNILTHRFRDGYNLDEVAKMLKISKPAVHYRIRQILKKLKRVYLRRQR